ncbi:hypothetical protein [Saccharolobus sp. E5-1-F]|nr:hypothetical protein [Sulfolobus sp. E5-1-F]
MKKAMSENEEIVEKVKKIIELMNGVSIEEWVNAIRESRNKR